MGLDLQISFFVTNSCLSSISLNKIYIYSSYSQKTSWFPTGFGPKEPVNGPCDTWHPLPSIHIKCLFTNWVSVASAAELWKQTITARLRLGFHPFNCPHLVKRFKGLVEQPTFNAAVINLILWSICCFILANFPYSLPDFFFLFSTRNSPKNSL